MAWVLRGTVQRLSSLVSGTVNTARSVLPACVPISQPARPLSTIFLQYTGKLTTPSSQRAPSAWPLLSAPGLTLNPVSVIPSRCYHVRVALKRRCASCYFVRRKGRLFVDCKAKPRHKQMQLMSKRKIWRDDYSKGNIRRALWWKFADEKRYYTLGDNQWARHDWLKGKIGVTV